jgi:NADP-dependent 3-hydroxy acid dehydrogenase YdfG
MNPSILVTGAGSGIGLAIVDALLAQGITVWAGARREAHLALLAERGARPLKLDVRDGATATSSISSTPTSSACTA